LNKIEGLGVYNPIHYHMIPYISYSTEVELILYNLNYYENYSSQKMGSATDILPQRVTGVGCPF
jgi:hypothetical protein